jgi:hypothetical protein
MAQGRANGLQGFITAVAKALGMGHGDANAPGMAHGAGKGPGRASVGNPGHNALSTKSSHSQNTLGKGGTHDGRSFSSHSRSTQSLAQHQTDHSKKADQVVEVEDRGPGKEKGIVDSRPPGQELQADRGTALNQDTIPSNPDDIVTLGLPPGQELQADRGMTLNLATIHSDLDDIVTLGPRGQELQADPGLALNPDTFHSDLDDIVTLGPHGQELDLGRVKSLPSSRPPNVGLWTIVPDTDETLATAFPHRWELGDDRAKILPSTNPELQDDDYANAGWKLVPYFGAAVLFFSGIVKSGLRARKRKAARLEFEPNALGSIGSVDAPRSFTPEDRSKPSGAHPPALDKFAAASSIAGEPQQKAADEKTRALLDPDVEKARAKSEHARVIEQAFRKDFDGFGLS